MRNEANALEEKKTWRIMDPPPRKKPIKCKLAYKVKFNVDVTIGRCKVRLVGKGFIQREGLNYHGTFSPMAKVVSVKLVLSLTAIKD